MDILARLAGLAPSEWPAENLGLATILSRKPSKWAVTFASALAATVCAWVPSASSEPAPATGQAQYQVLQNISYEFGSKFTSGYFIRQAGKCLIMLMVAEKSNPDQPLAFTAARVRMILNPGQIAGLDSEEGRSLNFTCGENAATIKVDAGERDRLIALQRSDLHWEMARAGGAPE